MTTASKSRASRKVADMSVLAAKDEGVTLTAIAATPVIAAREARATDASNSLASNAFKAGAMEVTTGVEMQEVAQKTTGPIAKLFFTAGNYAGRACALGLPDALVAVKADHPAWVAEWKTVTVRGENIAAVVNLPDIGDAMLDYGKGICEASRHGAKKANPGSFIRSKDEQRIYDAARKLADKLFMTPAEAAAKAAETSAKASEAAAKKKAAKEEEAKKKAEGAITRGNGENVKVENAQDATRLALNIATAGALVCRNNALHMPPRIAEAYNALERLAREIWEAEFQDADGDLN